MGLENMLTSEELKFGSGIKTQMSRPVAVETAALTTGQTVASNAIAGDLPSPDIGRG